MFTQSVGVSLGLVLVGTVFPMIAVAQDATAIATATPTASAALAPECARSCIQSSQQVQSECSPTDQACLCQHGDTIQAAISSCLADTKACSESDHQVAIAYYPQFCASYGLSSNGAVATTGANGIVTAAGQAPTQATGEGAGAGASSLVLTSTDIGPATTQTITAEDSNYHSHSGLTVPAILGITLGIFLIVSGLAAFAVYHHVRRRQMKRRTRFEFLTSEFGDQFADMDAAAVQRPPRSHSMNSQFVVQPTLPEKPTNEFDFGLDISRTSTLVSVAPPPPAKMNTNKDLPDIRASAYHIENSNDNSADADADAAAAVVGQSSAPAQPQRTSTLRGLLGNGGERLRASLLGGRLSASATKKTRGKAFSKPQQDLEKAEFDESNKI